MTTDLRDSFREQVSELDSMPLMDYLRECRNEKSMWANAAMQMSSAIGEPKIIRTSNEPRLARLFGPEYRVFAPFADFFGMEDVIAQIYAFFRHAGQGLEERRQMLYLLGPVAGGKSSLAERLKQLMATCSIWVLAAHSEEGKPHKLSPVYESPLSLFDERQHGKKLFDDYGIPSYMIGPTPSPWAWKRLRKFGGDISQFRVVRIKLSIGQQIGIAQVEPGDDDNDTTTLVGLRSQITGKYSYYGGLNRTTQGLMEFVEMFKAPPDMLHPLLTATQERKYAGTGNIGTIPYQGILLAHSNEPEWETFKNNPKNASFRDRMCIIRVPYNLRVTEEREIYRKLLGQSELAETPQTPNALDMLARFGALSRIPSVAHSQALAVMRVFDGEPHTEVGAEKPREAYVEDAGEKLGMTGFSTRDLLKVLSLALNTDPLEVGVDPSQVLDALTRFIRREFKHDEQRKYLGIIENVLLPVFKNELEEEIRRAYIENYEVAGQAEYVRYITLVDHWDQDESYKDPDTGVQLDRERINEALMRFEAGLTNPKEHRNILVKAALRKKAENGGLWPSWREDKVVVRMIEGYLFAKLDDALLEVIAPGTKPDEKAAGKHRDFVDRMMERSYTERQVYRLVRLYLTAKTGRKF